MADNSAAPTDEARGPIRPPGIGTIDEKRVPHHIAQSFGELLERRIPIAEEFLLVPEVDHPTVCDQLRGPLRPLIRGHHVEPDRIDLQFGGRLFG